MNELSHFIHLKFIHSHLSIEAFHHLSIVYATKRE